MNRTRSVRLGSLACVLFGGALFAQSAGVPEHEAAQQVAAVAPLQNQQPDAQGFLDQSQGSLDQNRGTALELVVEVEVDTESWRRRLTDADINARERALDDVVAGATRDRNLRYALRTWAADLTQPELAWSARMALRDLTRKTNGVRMAWVPRMETAGKGIIAILAPAQHPLAPGSDAGGNQLRKPPFEPNFPFAGPLKVSLFAPRAVEFPSAGRNASPSIRHVNVEVHPEGVVMTVRELVAGRTTVRVYAAESLDQILLVHPALQDQIPGLASLAARPSAAGVPLVLSGDPQGARRSLQMGGQTVPGKGFLLQNHTVILGVQCVPIPDEEAERRLLGPGVGLLIERREPGSVAEAMGLMRGDILVELLGQQLCSPEEISRVLRENHEERITVKIVDMNGLERTRTWQPAPHAPE